jgi:hypothetical protein
LPTKQPKKLNKKIEQKNWTKKLNKKKNAKLFDSSFEDCSSSLSTESVVVWRASGLSGSKKPCVGSVACVESQSERSQRIGSDVDEIDGVDVDVDVVVVVVDDDEEDTAEAKFGCCGGGENVCESVKCGPSAPAVGENE